MSAAFLAGPVDWQDILRWLGAGGALFFFGSLLAVPWLIGRMDAKYFTAEWSRSTRRTRCPVLLVMKNGIGLVLLAAGFAMLVLPGQGVLTMLIGLALLDLPGKHAVLGMAARRPRIAAALQWIRKKRGSPPFIL